MKQFLKMKKMRVRYKSYTPGIITGEPGEAIPTELRVNHGAY
jgi:hypothetical protein